MSGWGPSDNGGSNGGAGAGDWGGGRGNNNYGPAGGGNWGGGGPGRRDNNNGGGGGRWGREDRGNGSQGGGGGGYRIDRQPSASARGNRQQNQHRGGGGGGWGAQDQRRQDSDRRGGGAERHHPYANAQPSRGRVKEEDNDDEVQMDVYGIAPLEDKVTSKTWNDCSWDEKIASQHPDWIDRSPYTVNGKRYLMPGKLIEDVLPTCPFDALKDECRTEEWMKRKKKAAEVAFGEGWKAIQDDDFADCQLNEAEVKKFFNALPYNLFFLVSFDVLGIHAKDETHCYCPCSSKCAVWRKQFGLDDILDECKKADDCGNTFKSSEPHGLMQHLEIKSRNKIGLHFFVKLYIEELYGPPYCGNVGHKGLYPKSSKSHRQAEAHEKKIMIR